VTGLTMRPCAKLKLGFKAVIVLWLLLAVSCETRSGSGQLVYGTAEGDEVRVLCPVDLPLLDPTLEAEILNYPRDVAGNPVDPTRAAESRDRLLSITPPPRETAIPMGSLGALLPANPVSGRPPGLCVPQSNADIGSPFGGLFADEAALDRLGRLCGCDILGDVDEYSGGRVDLYLTTAGAREAFRMESQSISGRGFEDVQDVDQARLARVGDERTLRLDLFYVNGEKREHQKILLVRWHNIIARMELASHEPTEMLLDYAEQLGRNIEGVANGGGG
jgi:hypothetical protein